MKEYTYNLGVNVIIEETTFVYIMAIFCLIICPGHIIGGLSAIKGSLLLFYLSYTSKNWQNVQGKIIVSQVKKKQAEFEGFISYTYVPEIKYSFRINGNTFYGDRISFNQSWNEPNTPERAENIIAQYNLGCDVTVFYDVNAPEDSSLETGIGTTLIYCVIMSMIIGMLFLFAGVLALYAGSSIFLETIEFRQYFL